MRWIFVCLLFFNMFYFAWQFFLVSQREGVSPDSVQGVAVETGGLAGERLVLLKEVLTSAGHVSPPPSINRAVRRQQVQSVAREVVSPTLAPVPGGEGLELEGATSPSGGRVAPEPALELGAESGPGSVAEPGALKPELAPSGGVAGRKGSNYMCARIGPYDSEEMADGLAAGLRIEGVDLFVHADDAVYDVENWVLIPPLGGRAEALRMLRRLQSNKIDSYLITEGEFSNGISLGLFKQAASAQGVLARMASAGYEAEIHQIERKKSRYWVGLSGEFEPAEMREMLSQLVDDSGKINFSETFCEMFASTP